MSRVAIQITLKGPAVNDGSIELARLLTFGEHLQKTLEAIANNSDLDTKDKEISLTLTETSKGSFATTWMPTKPRQLSFANLQNDATIQALELFITGLNEIYTTGEAAIFGYSQPIIEALLNFGQKNIGYDVDAIDFDYESPAINQSVTYDKQSQAMVAELLEEEAREERIISLEGKLSMVSFKDNKCGIEHYNGTYTPQIAFEDDLSDAILDAARRDVFAIGIGSVLISDPTNIKHIRLTRLVRKEPDTTAEELNQLFREYYEEYDTASNFRKAWRESLAGETIISLSELWDSLDAD